MGWWTVGLWALASLAGEGAWAAGKRAPKRKADPNKIAFTATDSCSKTHVMVRYDVKAKGPWAHVTMTQQARQGTRARVGASRYLILNFETGSIKELFPKKKLYSVKTSGGLRGTPLHFMCQSLMRGKDAASFQKETRYKGTLFQGKTLATKFSDAQKGANFSESLFAIPQGYRRIPDNPGGSGSMFGGASPFQVHEGSAPRGGQIDSGRGSLPMGTGR